MQRPVLPDSVAPVITALAWGVAAGFLARAMLSDGKPGVLITVIAGFAGCALGYLVAHELLGRHDMHLFQAGALLPSTLAAFGMLLAMRSALRRASRRKRTFG